MADFMFPEPLASLYADEDDGWPELGYYDNGTDEALDRAMCRLGQALLIAPFLIAPLVGAVGAAIVHLIRERHRG